MARFRSVFAKTIYYDPREEGSVLATTKDGLNLILRPSVGRPTNRDCDGGDGDRPLLNDVRCPRLRNGSDADLNDALSQLPVNEIAFCQSAESRLYAGFAQNYLMTYFPAAYPRWFLQGFGEIFGTMKAGDDFVEYGQLSARLLPRSWSITSTAIIQSPTSWTVAIFRGDGKAWTPYHAWRLVHLLYFSDEWKPRLHNYLSAMARGADSKSAASAFGDPAELQKAVNAYRGRKLRVRADGLSGRARAGTDRPPDDPGGGRPDPGPARAGGTDRVAGRRWPRVARRHSPGARPGSTSYARMRGNFPS